MSEINEAIHELENCACSKEMRPHINTALSALRAQQEREKPLTLEEVKQMNGEWVWIERISGCKLRKWVRLDINDYGIDQSKNETSKFGAWDTYGETWIAYRMCGRKLEVEKDG